jgi:adenine-specific DNA methylase
MGIAIKYPKRLIEVDLPIKRISAHARREKSIRHGHICTLQFRKTARELMTKWAKDHLKLMSEESSKRFIAISKDDSKPVGVATYRMVKRLPKELKGQLPSPAEIA